jgi:hypothetical protein
MPSVAESCGVCVTLRGDNRQFTSSNLLLETRFMIMLQCMIQVN